MKTSKSVAYALASLRELAKQFGEYAQVSEIALAQNLPSAYCQKVLFLLARAGLVESVKGRGFILIKPMESITTLEVIQALDAGYEGATLTEHQRGNGGTLRCYKGNTMEEQDRASEIHEVLSHYLEKMMAGLTVAEVIASVR